MSAPHPADPAPIPKSCPRCGAGPGTLTLRPVLVAKPLGSFSLAGADMKASARTACDRDVVGHLSKDRNHFIPDDPADAPPATGGASDGSGA